ncbi:GNAT family N-acetyltransferase [Paenibacillus woosongensis]|uniref:GNAT family N-acetyltransferase n=1 Tax=Paenibacillus woosongensis TaxID=307580 RepID=UPI0039B6FF9C
MITVGLNDDKHQGKGYGKAAMEALIQFMSVSNCTRIMIGHRPDNQIAGNTSTSNQLTYYMDCRQSL